MKAIVVTGPGDVRMIETDRPVAGPGDVLVKVAYSGICGTDLSIASGDTSLVKEGLIRYPVRIGHEWSGVVETAGENVKDFMPGDRVTGDPAVSCGVCGHCRSGDYPLCEHLRSVGTINCWDGSFAEYMLMPSRHLHKLPGDTGLDEAALIEPATVALAGVKKLNITSDSTVLVMGTGAIGLAAVALAKNAGAKRVLLCGRKQPKLAIGKRMGADAVVNVTTDSLQEFVFQNTDGKGVNAVLETSGAVETISQCLQVTARAGTVALVGFYEAKLDGFDIDRVVTGEIQLRGIMGEFGLVEEVITILRTGALDLKPLITHRLAFEEAVEALRPAGGRNDTRIKMLVKIAGDI